MRKILFLFIFIYTTTLLYGQQSIADSSIAATSTDPVKYIYDATRGDESGIYNGILYYSYSSQIEGIPYFQTSKWQKGDIIFGNVLYHDIWMKYELISDQVIVSRDTINGVYVAIFSPRVKEFSYSGVQFVRLDKISFHGVPEHGFYRILTKGNLTAYQRSVKTIAERIEGTTLYRKFEEKIRYYIARDNDFFMVANKNELLDLCKDHKKEVQQFIKTNKLNYRKNPENTIIAVTAFYNRL